MLVINLIRQLEFAATDGYRMPVRGVAWSRRSPSLVKKTDFVVISYPQPMTDPCENGPESWCSPTYELEKRLPSSLQC